MVKYSIESALLNERMRIVLGFLFGGALLFGSYTLREHLKVDDSTRISQALVGAAMLVHTDVCLQPRPYIICFPLSLVLPAWRHFSLCC